MARRPTRQGGRLGRVVGMSRPIETRGLIGEPRSGCVSALGRLPLCSWPLSRFDGGEGGLPRAAYETDRPTGQFRLAV